jgi:hypothetical protein
MRRSGNRDRSGWLIATLAASVGGAAACGPDSVALPTPPLEAETTAVAAVYDAPTGTIDIDHLTQLAAEIQARIEDLQLDWLPGQIAEALVRLRQPFDDDAFPTDPAAAEDEDRARVRAVVGVTRICSGWAVPPGPLDAAENGSIELTAVVEDGRLRREAWGVATACRTRIALNSAPEVAALALNASVDGTLIVYLYGPLPRSIGEAKFLLRFDGEIGRADHVGALSFDFRILGASIEFRYGVDDGDIIVGIGIGTLTLQGQNGTFTCDLALRSCG